MDNEKKYNEALERVKPLYEWAKKDDNPIWSTYEYLFPELRESEDEKIRRNLVETFIEYKKSGGTDFHGIEIDYLLAWLEKQKVFAEHGYGLYYYHNGGFTFVARPAEEKDEENPYDFAMSQQEKQKEQTWIPTDEQRTALGMVLKHSDPDADSTKVLESLLDELTKIANPKVAKWKEKQKEQKPEERFKEAREKYQVEWSEEDNIGWDEAFACVTRAEKAVKNEEELQNTVTAEKWLKEIKFKYYVHPVKQEWSDEDERIKSCICLALTDVNEQRFKGFGTTLKDCLSWVKDLHPSWKPSEKQMEALEECGECKRCIKELYEQLMKLM